MINLVVWGLPAPQGSKRHVGGGRMIESSKAVGPWRAAVTKAAQDRLNELDHDRPLFPRGTPVHLMIKFHFARPKSHFGTGRNAEVLKPSAPTFPTGIPDLSKLIRSTEDALTEAAVWHDDSQVVSLTASKHYGQAAHAVITIKERKP